MAEAIIRQPETKGITMVPIVRQSTATNASDITLNMKPIRDTVTTISRPTTDSTVTSNDHILTSNGHTVSSNGQYVGTPLNSNHGTPMSYTITQNSQTVSHPVTLVPWSEFISNPSLMHGLFDDTPGSLNYDPKKVTVLLGPKDDELAKSARTLRVKTVEDLIRVRNDIMRKPVLWQTRLTYRQKFFMGFSDRHATISNKTTFAVLLDAKHPAVAETLTTEFNKAREIILRGGNFCLEMSLTECLDERYAALVHAEPLEEDCTSNIRASESLGTRIYITNTSPYEHGFDCDDCWFGLGCCWILSAPCYMGFRKLHTKDLICKLDVDTPILHRTTTERQQTTLELLATTKTNTPIIDPFAAPIYDYGRPQYNGHIHFAEDM